MPQENAIINFLNQGNDLLSEEGRRLINNSDQSIVAEAAKNSTNALRALVTAREKSSDPHFRRKILLAITN